MNPDNRSLFFWLEDELTSSAQPSVEAWCASQPEWLSKREAVRSWKAVLPRVMAAELALPYPDFFQSKLMQAIEQDSQFSVNALAPPLNPRWWSRLWLPATALAAMALCFLGGMQFTKNSPQINAMVIYTPELGVDAKYFQTSPAEGSVIVLNGIAALPDSFEVPQTSTSSDSNPPDGVGREKNKEEAIISP